MERKLQKGIKDIVIFKQPSNTFLLCFIMGVLLCLRAVNDLFVYPALLFGLAAVFFASPANVICLLLFTLPLGNIFKINPDVLSFFTLMFLLFGLRLLISKPIKVHALISAALFGIYLILISGMGQIIAIITIMVGFLLIFYCTKEEVDYSKVILSYSAGILVATLLGMMMEQLPIIGKFISEVALRIDMNETVSRFSGLHGNPNYFTMDVILALAGLSQLMLIKKTSSRLYIVLFCVLSIIGFLSISKSFLLAWAILLIWMLISSVQIKASKSVKTVLVIGCCIGVLCFFAQDSINAYIARFTEDAGSDIADVTTGRTDIWKDYLQAMLDDGRLLFFGNGVGGKLVNSKGTHNSYIEALYTVGITGLLLYAYALFSAVKKQKDKKKLIQFTSLVVLLVRLFGIGIFINDTIWFYIILVVLAINTGVGSPETEGINNEKV